MGAGYFIIAIMGCAEGAGGACTPVTTVPARFDSRSECEAAAPDALIANSKFDFPELLAQCRAVARPASAEQPSQKPARITRLGRQGSALRKEG